MWAERDNLASQILFASVNQLVFCLINLYGCALYLDDWNISPQSYCRCCVAAARMRIQYMCVMHGVLYFVVRVLLYAAINLT